MTVMGMRLVLPHLRLIINGVQLVMLVCDAPGRASFGNTGVVLGIVVCGEELNRSSDERQRFDWVGVNVDRFGGDGREPESLAELVGPR